jgi:general secretion pathway protein G
LGKFNFSKSNRSSRFLNSDKGFTLIELLVVIIMLGVLATFTIMTLDPMTQIQKGQNAQREEDLKQLNSALDTYYNDNNCYPQSAGNIPAPGNSWTSSDGKTVYMKKVPGDPSANSGWQNYAYVTDGTTCPQWNVLFAKVALPPKSSEVTDPMQIATRCPLVNVGGTCVPQNFDSGHTYCVLSGNIDCTAIQGFNGNNLPIISGPGGGGGGGETPPGDENPACSCSQAIRVMSNGICNSHIPGTDLLGNPGYCSSDCNGPACTMP